MSGISESLLAQLAGFVGARTGLHFEKERMNDLENRIKSAAADYGFKDVEECIKWLVTSPLTKQEIEILASHLTVGETYFFREIRSFEILERDIFPTLIRSRIGNEKQMRIWSAGCATGEEPYSIAMLLKKMIPDQKDWSITILATDINPHFLQKARDGFYREWSFRDSPGWIRKYFEKTKEGYGILPEIKDMVTFSYHNLAEDSYPTLLNNTNAMDIILCRNVLMYFSHERTKQVVRAFYQCLVDNGWLVVSPVEASDVLFSQYATVNFKDAIFYRKDISKSREKEEFIPDEIRYPVHEETWIAPVALVPEQPLAAPGKKTGPVTKERKITGQETAYNKAILLYGQGKYKQVIELLEGLPAPDTKTMVLLAKAFANSGKSARALEWCEKALVIDKLNSSSNYLHAMILQERGQVEEVVKSLKRALYLDQDFILVHFALGNLGRQLGKTRESNRHFENALLLLKRWKYDEVLPESEGITAGRLSEIITTIKGKEILHER